jgi:hypothetical protein
LPGTPSLRRERNTKRQIEKHKIIINYFLLYDLNNKQLVYQEPNAYSIAWNTQFKDRQTKRQTEKQRDKYTLH